MRQARTKVAVAAVVVMLTAIGALALVGVLDDDGATGPPTVPRALAQARGAINEIYERSRESVVFVQAVIVREQGSPFGPQVQRGIAAGTGFVIDDEGSVVTNAHVIEGAREVSIRVAENSLVRAEVVGSDAANDLALLRVDPDKLDADPLVLGDSDDVRVGDPVLALGNPLGLEDTITAGIVSAKQRRITAPNGLTIENVIQTDAAVNQGNSGGPLLDMHGRVVGVNSQIATSGRGTTGFIGIAFAVPVKTVKEIIPDLADDGQIDRARLGVTTVTLTPALAQQLGLDVKRGALVVGVTNASPAAEAGVRGAGTPRGALTRGGDVIVRVGDREIDSAEDLRNAIADLRQGDSVPIELVRDGDRRTLQVPLGKAG
ncbi:MAG: trypsin-like peptidase domain-containing protein [Actinomycetota bacterium]|nr:trypsin-like peptidase domain-containing protein [Actinomycetota bacterium]